MAISGSNLTYGDSTTAGSSISTASVTPSPNALILASVATRTGITADPTLPTASGCGLTWVVVNSVVFDPDSTSRRRITTFRGMGASPTSGAITFDEAGQTQTSWSWSVDQFTGTDTTGTNGSGAIVQSATNYEPDGAAGTSLTVTLAAFDDANNATFGAFATGDSTAITVGSGFTILGADTGSADVAIILKSEWKSTNDTTVDMGSMAVNVNHGGIAIEIRSAIASNLTFSITNPQIQGVKIINN